MTVMDHTFGKALMPPPPKPLTLTLALKGEYFDQIACGQKVEEFRMVTPFWVTRLVGKDFSRLVITKGYAKSGDTSRRLEFAWAGFERRILLHPHFGSKPVEVFAISLAKPLSPLPKVPA